MTLRWKLIFVTSAVVFVLFGISEWLSYRHTATQLEQHESILTTTTDQVALEKLIQSVTTMRVFYAALTLLVSTAVLNYVWYRVVYRPVRRQLAQINTVRRGQIPSASNELDQQLTFSFQHVKTSSRLSAFAPLGDRLAREVFEARVEVLAATGDSKAGQIGAA